MTKRTLQTETAKLFSDVCAIGLSFLIKSLCVPIPLICVKIHGLLNMIQT